MSRSSTLQWPIATFVNMLAVAVGSILGLLLQSVFNEDIQGIVFQAVGLGTILIGLKMALRLPDGYMLIFIFALILGGILGEVIGLAEWMSSLSDQLKLFVGASDSNFTEGLITAFLLFCIGSMTIVGALEEGLSKNRSLIYVKSTLDGFTAIALTASFGIGVLFSIIPMLIFQGGITVLAVKLKPIFDQKTLDLVSAVGGILIIGISINMLQLGEITLENLLPSLLVAIIFSKTYQSFKGNSK
ncbi:DUF554 domain-containing protein [Saprospiraceae bacterium]|jgi:uncharacterized protein|nr:DUF554 domain-containing protein [Saprospiraceae bacterium]HCV51321.1 DUF554 domain-containing protein [Saprospirales bacterium]MDA9299251.1 DUF554 domain-containing protein [Saprospiraceae bacterium]MDA9333174.1 DUF554 domain-containing protein [Saprospiraceae bacterium]MDA9866640.1 DUF554 domain-containing protein [Saprospiraceae bacterium]|tara:strand:+ start:1344 stop:2075 length:732 start_codon:yes stop_codon:yes gene_type:complete